MKLILILGGFLFVASLHEAAAQAPPASTPEAAYAAGTEAMNQQRWPDAVHDFDRVIDANGRQTDAALYWKAYSLNRLARGGDMHTACDVLRAKFPASSWNKDCAALLAGHGHSWRGPVAKVPRSHQETYSGSDEDDDVKILALNSVAAHDPAQAAPVLRQMILSNTSPRVRSEAIFALTQNHAPEMEALLRDALNGTLGHEIQVAAIPEVGALAGSRWNHLFVETYHSSSDPEVKRATISALFVSGDASDLIDMARGESNLEWKRTIVSELALMNNKLAQQYMLELLK